METQIQIKITEEHKKMIEIASTFIGNSSSSLIRRASLEEARRIIKENKLEDTQ